MYKSSSETVEDFLGNNCYSVTDNRLSDNSVDKLGFSLFSLESSYEEIFQSHKGFDEDDEVYIPTPRTDSGFPEDLILKIKISNYLSSVYTFSETIKQITQSEFGEPNKIKLYLYNSEYSHPPKSLVSKIQFLIGLRHLVQHGFSNVFTISKVNDENYSVSISTTDFCNSNNWDQSNSENPEKYLNYIDGNYVYLPRKIWEFHHSIRVLTNDLYINAEDQLNLST